MGGASLMDGLLRVALAGTSRTGGELPPPTMPTDELAAPSEGRSVERQVLLRAGARAIYRRAGGADDPPPPSAELTGGPVAIGPYQVTCGTQLAEGGSRAVVVAAGVAMPRTRIGDAAWWDYSRRRAGCAPG